MSSKAEAGRVGEARARRMPAESADGTEVPQSRGITSRAMLLAIVLMVAMTPAAFVAGTVWGPDILTADAPSVWPTCLLVLMTAAMGTPLLRRVGLGRREVLSVYALVLVAAPLSSYTVLFYAIPKVIIYYHVARANPAWETTFVQHLPLWWGPTSELARNGFFLGKSHVPWGEWGLPMAAWGSFMTALFTATLCGCQVGVGHYLGGPHRL